MLPPPSLPLPSWFSDDWPLRQAFTGRVSPAREREPELQQDAHGSLVPAPAPQLHSLSSGSRHAIGSRSELAGEPFEVHLPSKTKKPMHARCEGDWSFGRNLPHVNHISGDDNLDPSVTNQNCQTHPFQENSASAAESENGMRVDVHTYLHAPGIRDRALEWQIPIAAGLSGPSFTKREPRDLENSSGGDVSTLTMSNVTSASGDASDSSGSRADGVGEQQQLHAQAIAATSARQPVPLKKKRSLPGTPDPDAEVIALSPRTLLATNRFVCEICNKGFQRDQNLQLHRRGHNLPWKLRQRTSKDIRKRVYICPEPSCVHHDPARALGDLTGIKKHFCRKHGEKKWKCDRCSKKYAVQSDWKAHMKTCGTREYRCDCGTLFSRRDSFITHRAFCDALAEENARVSAHRQGDSTRTTLVPESLSDITSASAHVSLTFLGASSPHQSIPGGPGGSFIPSAVSRPAMHNGLAFGEGGMAALSSRWDSGAMQHRRSGPGMTNANPRLSLLLGTGPGPGPPASFLSEGASEMHHSDSQTDSGVSYVLQPSCMHNALPLTGLRGSSDFNLPNMSSKISAGMTHLPTTPVSFFTSEDGTQVALLGQRPLADTGQYTEGVAVSARAAPSPLSSTGPVTNSSRSNAVSVGAFYGQEQQGANAQMSATALLQKAAMMGATASDPSVFRNFGIGSEDSSSSIIHGGTMQAPIKNAPISPYQSMIRISEQEEFSTGIQGFPDQPLQSSSPSGPPSGNQAVHDIMNSFAGTAVLFNSGPNGLSSGNTSQSLLRNDHRFLDHQSFAERSMFQQAHLLCGSPQSLPHPSLARSLIGGPQSCEEGDYKPTLDFLGVGGTSGMASQAISHRDLASIMSMGTGMEFLSSDDQKENLMSEGVSGNSQDKSWDSS